MKFNLDEFYSVNITASFGGKKGTSEDSFAVLNEISLAYREASEMFTQKGAFAIAKDFKRKADNIYNFLKSKGYYDQK